MESRTVLYCWDNTHGGTFPVNQPSIEAALTIADYAADCGYDLLSIVANGDMPYNQTQLYTALGFVQRDKVFVRATS